MTASDEMFRNLERELFAAHEGTPDLTVIDRLYADDFVSINADGRVVNKQEWLDILRSGQFPVEKITTDEFKVRILGHGCDHRPFRLPQWWKDSMGGSSHAGLEQSERSLAIGQLAGDLGASRSLTSGACSPADAIGGSA